MTDAAINIALRFADEATGPFNRATSMIKRNAVSLASNLGSIAIKAAAATAALAAFAVGFTLKRSIDEAKQFETVLTDMGKVTDRSLGAIRREVMAMEPALGSATELMRGYYQTISAGVTEPKAALETLTVAAKASKAAHIDQSETIKALTKVMAGYGGEIKNVTEASDLLFTIEKLGQTSFAELVPVIGDVAAISHTLGVRTQEMGAALATITQTAGSTSEAATQYRGILLGLYKPNEQMVEALKDMGVQSGVAAVQQFGLAGAIQKVIEYSDKTGVSLGKYFRTSESLLGIAALSNAEFGKYIGNLKGMGTAAGSTERAYAAWGDTMEALSATYHNTLGKIMIEIGTTAAPAVRVAMQAITGALESLLEKMNELKDQGKLDEWAIDLAEGVVGAFQAIVKISASVMQAFYGIRLAFASIAEGVSLFVDEIVGYYQKILELQQKGFKFVGWDWGAEDTQVGIDALKDFRVGLQVNIDAAREMQEANRAAMDGIAEKGDAALQFLESLKAGMRSVKSDWEYINEEIDRSVASQSNQTFQLPGITVTAPAPGLQELLTGIGGLIAGDSPIDELIRQQERVNQQFFKFAKDAAPEAQEAIDKIRTAYLSFIEEDFWKKMEEGLAPTPSTTGKISYASDWLAVANILKEVDAGLKESSASVDMIKYRQAEAAKSWTSDWQPVQELMKSVESGLKESSASVDMIKYRQAEAAKSWTSDWQPVQELMKSVESGLKESSASVDMIKYRQAEAAKSWTSDWQPVQELMKSVESGLKESSASVDMIKYRQAEAAKSWTSDWQPVQELMKSVESGLKESSASVDMIKYRQAEAAKSWTSDWHPVQELMKSVESGLKESSASVDMIKYRQAEAAKSWTSDWHPVQELMKSVESGLKESSASVDMIKYRQAEAAKSWTSDWHPVLTLMQDVQSALDDLDKRLSLQDVIKDLSREVNMAGLSGINREIAEIHNRMEDLRKIFKDVDGVAQLDQIEADLIAAARATDDWGDSWGRLADNLQSNLSDVFFNVLDGADNVFEGILNSWKRLIANMLAEAMTLQVKNWLKPQTGTGQPEAGSGGIFKGAFANLPWIGSWFGGGTSGAAPADTSYYGGPDPLLGGPDPLLGGPDKSPAKVSSFNSTPYLMGGSVLSSMIPASAGGGFGGWLQGGMSGASMGSMAGPWGALAGGVIGSTYGGYQSGFFQSTLGKEIMWNSILEGTPFGPSGTIASLLGLPGLGPEETEAPNIWNKVGGGDWQLGRAAEQGGIDLPLGILRGIKSATSQFFKDFGDIIQTEFETILEEPWEFKTQSVETWSDAVNETLANFLWIIGSTVRRRGVPGSDHEGRWKHLPEVPEGGRDLVRNGHPHGANHAGVQGFYREYGRRITAARRRRAGTPRIHHGPAGNVRSDHPAERRHCRIRNRVLGIPRSCGRARTRHAGSGPHDRTLRNGKGVCARIAGAAPEPRAGGLGLHGPVADQDRCVERQRGCFSNRVATHR